MKWKAAMSLPEEDEGLFEKIEWLDLDKEEATKLVAKFNEEGEAYKKKMEEKYPERAAGRYNSGSRRPDNRRSDGSNYSNPPPVVYSTSGSGGSATDSHAQQWQEYYKKYYEFY